MNEIERDMAELSRLLRGLINVMEYDVECISTDVENFNVVRMGESIRETRNTLTKMLDNITELEYLLYLLKRQ